MPSWKWSRVKLVFTINKYGEGVGRLEATITVLCNGSRAT